MGQRFKEMGQKCKNKLFLAQTANLESVIFSELLKPKKLKKSKKNIYIMVHPNFKPISHQEEISQM